MARGARSWTRQDSLVVLASYVERPSHLMVPPQRERERVANLLRQEVAEVTARLWAFATLDESNDSSGGTVGRREEELWERYADDRMELMVDADAILDERKRVPHYLS